MRRLIASLAGLATAIGLLVPTVHAQPAVKPPTSPLDAPPPASLENHDVEAWADAYLHTEGWTLLTHDLEGAHLTSHKGVLATHAGVVELEIRTELFHPVEISPGAARSGVARWSVDCAKKRLAILSMTAYSHNNLQGELARKPVGAAKIWQDPNESEAVTIGVICQAARSGKPLTPKGLGGAKPSV